MSGESANNSLLDLLTVSQAASLLGTTTKTMRNWDNTGKLKAIRHPINGYRLYRRSEIEQVAQSISNAFPMNGEQHGH